MTVTVYLPPVEWVKCVRTLPIENALRVCAELTPEQRHAVWACIDDWEEPWVVAELHGGYGPQPMTFESIVVGKQLRPCDKELARALAFAGLAGAIPRLRTG